MSLKVYRIDSSVSGKIANFFKKADLPVEQHNFASIGNPLKNLKDITTKDFYVLSKKDEIDRFSEAYGDNFIKDKYYIRHPKANKTSVLIPIEKFQKYIIREQLADMVSYIRANVRVKKLKIEIKKGASSSIKMNGLVEGMPLEGEARAYLNTEYSIIIDCARPLKASEKKTEYTWINEFTHLQAVIDETFDSRFEINESYDIGFGFGVKQARAVGLDFSGDMNHHFKIEVESA